MSDTTNDQNEQPAQVTYTDVGPGPDGTQVEYAAPPTAAPEGADPAGHWEHWVEEVSPTDIVRHWYWAPPAPPTEAEIKAGLAREQLAASVALQADLDASIGELSDAVAKLDPAAMRQPARGFDAMGFTVIGEAEINRTNESIADVAEAIQKSMAALQANAAANAKTIEATNAVLEAVPVNVAMLSAPAEQPAE